MWLVVLLVILSVLAVGGGGWGHSRYSYWSWSPLAVLVTVGLVMYFSGFIRLHS